ncbi:MAG TPA: hypothetical protein VM890_00400, partial [Longimicrobium sp.]|nr:hypothetical protein [Longimicrobium sp.]
GLRVIVLADFTVSGPQDDVTGEREGFQFNLTTSEHRQMRQAPSSATKSAMILNSVAALGGARLFQTCRMTSPSATEA